MNEVEIAAMLRSVRREKGISFKGMARITYLAPTTIYNVEANKRHFSISTLLIMARVLDLEVMLVPKESIADKPNLPKES